MNLETMRAGYRRIRRPVASGADADVDNGGCADRGGRRLNLMRDEQYQIALAGTDLDVGSRKKASRL